MKKIITLTLILCFLLPNSVALDSLDSLQALQANTQKQIQPHNRPPPHIKEAEINCLANAIYQEARGETLIGQKAVGHVILNRTKHSAFPNSVCGVISQRSKYTCQFSWACKNNKTRITDELHTLAKGLLYVKTKDPTGGALFFHSNTSQVVFNRKRTAVIGNHIFYK